MVSGLIELGSAKEDYLKKVIKDDKNDFLQNSFSLIFDSLKAELFLLKNISYNMPYLEQ